MTPSRARPRPLVAGLLAAGVGLTVHAGGVAPAAAAVECVGVVVDARLLGGGVRTGCASGDPRSGLDALTRAGFSYAFVPRQPGLVCQIDGLPECSRTTATTYWSYWHRAPGSSRWTYSTQGAASFDPKPGSVEAWVWQDGGRVEPPDVALRTACPQAASPAATSSETRSSRPSRTAGPTAAATSPRDRAATGPGDGETTRENRPGTQPRRRTKPAPGRSATPTDPATETASAAPTPTGSPSASPGGPDATAVEPVSREARSDAPLLGLLLGGGLVVLLGGAAAWRARRGPESPGGPP